MINIPLRTGFFPRPSPDLDVKKWCTISFCPKSFSVIFQWRNAKDVVSTFRWMTSRNIFSAAIKGKWFLWWCMFKSKSKSNTVQNLPHGIYEHSLIPFTKIMWNLLLIIWKAFTFLVKKYLILNDISCTVWFICWILKIPEVANWPYLPFQPSTMIC